MFKKIHYNSPVILSYTFLAFMVLILDVATEGSTTKVLFSVYTSPLDDPFFYIRLFGHVLGHANLQHYFNNFLIILLIGPFLEERYGSLRLLICIIITALFTGLLNVILFSSALLGASGIAFMFIVLSSFVSLQRGRIPLTFIVIVVIFLGKESFDAVYNSSNISHLTHIAGGLCGAVIGFFMNFLLAKKTEPLKSSSTSSVSEVASTALPADELDITESPKKDDK